MKIGIIGGSFDPVHIGHTKIMKEAIKNLDLDKLLVMPTKNNPWKDGSIASTKQRIDMLNIAIKDMKEAVVDTTEIDMSHDEKNYTIDTIHILKDKYPDDLLYYIVGMDQVNSFDKWKKAKEISKLVKLVAFKRKGYKKNDNLKKYNFKLIDIKASGESSTDFRNGNTDVVSPEVLKYICNEGIYLEQIVSRYMSNKRFLHTCSVASLAATFARSNGLDDKKAYIAGMFHDVAKEMKHEKALKLMKKHYPEFVDKPAQIYHQWLSAYMCQHDFYIEDKDILQAIENHTTASVDMAPLDMCVYCADKLDPLREYDSSKQIELCKKDIVEGFKNELVNFYEFSKMKNRDIDECFFDVYHVFCKGEKNG